MITQERRLEMLTAIRSLTAFPYNVYPGSALDLRLIELVRELWPVQAKPLVWRNPHGPYVAGDYMIAIDSGGVFRASYNLTQIFGCKAPAHEALAQCQVACEDHHQARFLEQLAC